MKIKTSIGSFAVGCMALVILSACQAVGNNTLITTATYTGVIFSAENARQARPLWQEPQDYWTPEKTDIEILEDGIENFLTENADLFYRQPPVWQRLPEYKRQYFGIIEDGNQIIYANFFCIDPDIDWRSQFLFVLDGGDCFLQVKFAIEENRFYDLTVNGEA